MMLEDPSMLVISAGISDLQPLIITDDGRRLRALVQRNNRRWHEAILAGCVGAVISDVAADVSLPEVQIVLPDTPFDSAATIRLADEPECSAMLVKHRGALVLAAPKLFALREQIRASGPILSACLVFYTHRHDSGPFAAEEPVALGSLLCDWFRPLCRPGAYIETVPYLIGAETLEDPQRHLALGPHPVTRIEAALRQLYRLQPSACVLLAAEGGPPSVKEYLVAATTLFFPSERVLRYQRTALITGTVLTPPSLMEAVLARRQARSHVRRGSFAEAWAIAEPFDHDLTHSKWVNPLFYASQFFSRQLIEADPERGALPQSLKRFDAKRTSRSLWVALRVEAALRRQSWIEAINATITFFDCLLLDAIEKCLPKGAQLDDRRRLLHWPDVFPLPQSLCDESFWVLEPIGPSLYRYDAVGRAQAQWLAWIDEPTLEALAYALMGPARTARATVGPALVAGHGALPTPLSYRHLNTHNRLTAEELEKARQCFVQSGLWAATGASLGAIFLEQPLIRDALGWLLDEPDPVRYYRDLVYELEQALLDPASEGDLPKDKSCGFIPT